MPSFWKLENCGQTVLPERSLLMVKNGGKCQNWKIQMRHFGWFSNNVFLKARIDEYISIFNMYASANLTRLLRAGCENTCNSPPRDRY